MKAIALALLLCFTCSLSNAAKPPKLTKEERAAYEVPPHDVLPPETSVTTYEQVVKTAWKSGQKREPAQVRGTGVNQSDALKAFTARYLAVRDGYTYAALIEEYNRQYDSLKDDDLKYVIIRLATQLPLKGVIWRAVPAIHKQIVTQELMLSQLKNNSENLLIHQPDSHIQAQLGFFSLPFPEHVQFVRKLRDPAGKYVNRFYNESDFVAFMAKDVYNSLDQATRRLEALRQGKKTIVFDARIRFGEHAFDESYDNHDRYRVIGEAEYCAQLARYHRRMAAIAQLAAYNWSGYAQLTKEIGNMYGIDVAKSSTTDKVFNLFLEEVYVDGVDRAERVNHTKTKANLFKLIEKDNAGKGWMNKAYAHYGSNIGYLYNAWEAIKNSKNDHEFALLDAEVLRGRKEQVQQGINNMVLLYNGDPRFKGTEREGEATIRGALSGDTLVVNVKKFYADPPGDLKELLADGFSDNSEVITQAFKDKFPDISSSNDMVTMKVGDVSGVKWRNYLHGRAISWKTTDRAWGKLFPSIQGQTARAGQEHPVAKARRILGETRGARFVTNNIMAWVK